MENKFFKVAKSHGQFPSLGEGGAKATGEGNKVSCAEHTEKNLSSNRLSVLTTLKHKLDCFAFARNDDLWAKHTVKDLLSNRPIVLTTFKKVAFTKPSRGTSEARDEFQSTKMLNFRCWNERCRLMRGAAFTLAEVLITLGIIGVVAALTLPTLIQNHQKQTYVTGLKKAYANLQNAFAKMAYDEGVTEWSQTSCFSNGWGNVNSEDCFNRIKKQFNVVKSEHFDYWQDDWAGFSGIYGYIYTNDGMIYLIDCFGRIDVDVNGDKGPNKNGRDRFYFLVQYDKNRVVPDGINYYQTYCTTAYVNSGSWGASTCTAKVLIEGKMDY